MANVCEINDIDELWCYRPVWRSLLQHTAWASFFLSFEWLEIYWRHFCEGQKLRVLVVSSGGRPVGILPLVVLTERTKVGEMRVLTYPLHNWGSFYGPIGPAPLLTLTAGLEYIRGRSRDWDLVELRWAGYACSDQQQTGPAMRAAGFQSYRTVWDRVGVVDLAGTWEAYVASHSSKWRNNLQRWERKLRDCGEVLHLRYRPRGEEFGEGDPRWDLYDACEEVARNSWQGDSTTGTTLSHESVRPFLRDVHAGAARLGAVDLNLLLVDRRPFAFAYNYQWNGSVYGLRAGYNQELCRAGAGNILILRMIRDSFLRRDRFFDMGAGYLATKRPFITRTIPLLRYGHYPVSVPRTQVLRVKRWMQQFAAKKEVARQNVATPS
jgi:hypothetical protein